MSTQDRPLAQQKADVHLASGHQMSSGDLPMSGTQEAETTGVLPGNPCTPGSLGAASIALAPCPPVTAGASGSVPNHFCSEDVGRCICPLKPGLVYLLQWVAPEKLPTVGREE